MAKPFRIDNCDEGLVQSARHLYIKKLTEYGENVMMIDDLTSEEGTALQLRKHTCLISAETEGLLLQNTLIQDCWTNTDDCAGKVAVAFEKTQHNVMDLIQFVRWCLLWIYKA